MNLKEARSYQKKMFLTIMEEGLNSKGDDIFVSYAPHVDSLEVRIYNGKWGKDKEPQDYRVYLPKDFDNDDNTEEIRNLMELVIKCSKPKTLYTTTIVHLDKIDLVVIYSEDKSLAEYVYKYEECSKIDKKIGELEDKGFKVKDERF